MSRRRTWFINWGPSVLVALACVGGLALLNAPPWASAGFGFVVYYMALWTKAWSKP